MKASATQEVEAFDNADEERAEAIERSRGVFDQIVWAAVLWTDADKHTVNQWDGYVDGREVGYVAFDLETGMFRAYERTASPVMWQRYRLISECRKSTEAKHVVMHAIGAVPRALCDAFAAFTPYERPEDEEEEGPDTGAVLTSGK